MNGVETGRSHPVGAHVVDGGVNFSVASEHATGVELLLFERADDPEPAAVVPLYAADGRPPTASVNFVTCHDGFTLNDLVSYNEKHNEANPEGNGSGSDDNLSWNCGVEGETDDPAVEALPGGTIE